MKEQRRPSGTTGETGDGEGRTRVLVVGGDPLFRDCLAAQLAELPGVAVVGRPRDLAHAAAWLRHAQADVALVELRRARRADLVRFRRLARDHPRLALLVLGLSPTCEGFAATVESGASGWLTPEASLGELDEALASVLRGQTHCPPEVAHELFRLLAHRARERARREAAELLPLTARELEVLRLVARGRTNREIAEQIHLSHYTVKSHVHRILQKLGVPERGAAVALADRRGWLRERNGAARMRVL